MCYSAMVEQGSKKLGLRYKVRVDYNAFNEFYMRKADAAQAILDGEKPIEKYASTKALDWEFLKEPEGKKGQEIKSQILRYHDLVIALQQKEVEFQGARVKAAQEKLKKKTTKAATNDIRIGTAKVEKAMRTIQQIKDAPHETDLWIWPKDHFPAVLLQEGELVVRPLRYLFRPNGQPPAFDKEYSGAYNMRSEKIDQVFFWKEVFGRSHAITLVHRFRELEDEEGGQHLKIVGRPRKEFELDPGHPITVPLIWNHWVDKKNESPDIWTSGAITCQAPEHLVKLGVDRLLTPLRDDYVESFLHPKFEMRDEYKLYLADYEWEQLRYKQVA